MTPEPTDPKTLDDGGVASGRTHAGTADHQAGTVAQHWAARLARLDLDAESLEMIMAALTADVCDEIVSAPDA